MGIGTLGFLSGASKTALSSIEAREEADRKKKLAEDLEKLRREGEKIAREDGIANEDKKVDEKLTEVDWDTGKKRFYNSKRSPLGEAEITQAERDAYNIAKEKERVSLDNTRLTGENLRSQIEERGPARQRDERRVAAYEQQVAGSGREKTLSPMEAKAAEDWIIAQADAMAKETIKDGRESRPKYTSQYIDSWLKKEMVKVGLAPDEPAPAESNYRPNSETAINLLLANPSRENQRMFAQVHGPASLDFVKRKWPDKFK